MWVWFHTQTHTQNPPKIRYGLTHTKFEFGFDTQFLGGFGYGFGYETHTQTQTQILGVNV